MDSYILELLTKRDAPPLRWRWNIAYAHALIEASGIIDCPVRMLMTDRAEPYRSALLAAEAAATFYAGPPDLNYRSRAESFFQSSMRDQIVAIVHRMRESLAASPAISDRFILGAVT